MEGIYKYTSTEFILMVIIHYPQEVVPQFLTSMYFKVNQYLLGTMLGHGLQRIIIEYTQDQTQQALY